MDEDCLLGTQGGSRHDARGLLGKKRAEALAKVTRRQFYQSDRVKTFNSKLLLSETLKTREEHMEIKRQMEVAAEDETRKLMAQVRQRDLEAVEQEREKAKRRERERVANHEGLMQQLRIQDLTMKLEKEKEAEECQRWRERYEREKAEQRRREQEEKVSARKAHEYLVSRRDAIRAREALRQAEEEERRRLVVEEKERGVRKREEEAADRFRELQRHKQKVADQLAAQLREKAGREEERNSRVAARVSPRHDRDLEQKQREADKKKATLEAIGAIREERRRAWEERTQEEQTAARDTLRANQEADRAHWEAEELVRQRKKEERFSMDDVLRRQMAERAAKAQQWRCKLLEAGRRNEQLLAEEEEQFQHYATEVTEAAAKSKRNTCALHKAARHTKVCGLGPLTGGLRAGYLLASSPSRVPDYISTTQQDINKLYASPHSQDNRKLEFIW